MESREESTEKAAGCHSPGEQVPCSGTPLSFVISLPGLRAAAPRQSSEGLLAWVSLLTVPLKHVLVQFLVCLRPVDACLMRSPKYLGW